MPAFEDRLRAALVGRYEIEREIGHGGMAVVYLARDVRHERPVALKVLHAHVAEALGAVRFLREIKVAARLHHPHLLPLFDSGEAAGALYYVSPYVEEGSLRQRMQREGPLPADVALRLTQEIADALAHAHRLGVVHRDIKPENVLLEEGHAVVADFGVARAVSAAADTHLTQSGLLIGTPAYMSPEQLAGETELDGRSDVFAVGCVLFEMLAGSPAFVGATPLAVLANRLTAAMPGMRQRGVTVPPAVEALVERAMAPAPADRFQSAGELAEAAADARAGTPRVVATPSGLPQPSRVATLAVLPFVNMSSEPENEFFSDGITEELINALTRVEGLRVTARSSAFAYKGRDVDVREIGQRLNVGAVLEGSVRRAGDRVRVSAQLIDATDGYHLWSESYDRQLADLFVVQDELARAIVTTLRPRFAGGVSGTLVRPPTEDLEAYNSYLRGLHFFNRRTVEDFHRAVDYFRSALARDPRYASAHVGVANCYTFLGFDWFAGMPPAAARPRATEAVLRALEIDPDLAAAYASLGVVRMLFDWNRPEAEAHFRRAIELNPRDAFTRNWYGIFLALGGRHDEAMVELEHALESDPLSIAVNATVARLHYLARRYDDATRVLKRTLELDPHYVSTYVLQAHLLIRTGRHHEAAASLETALAIGGRQPVALGLLGRAMASSGREQEALAVLDELRAMRRVRHVPSFTFANVHLGLGHYDEAMTGNEQAVEEGSTICAWMACEPLYDLLRGTPRFERLLARVQAGAP